MRLESLLCLVVGAFGKVSEDLDRIIRALYLSRVAGKPVSTQQQVWMDTGPVQESVVSGR